jgi:hypothetical protein
VLAVAEEMDEDAPRAAPERVQPQTYEAVRDLALERRVAMLESQLEDQERAMRRVLTLLVDWVESGEDAVIHHAA